MYTIGNKHFKLISLYLGDYRKKYHLRNISRLSGIPLKTTQNILKNLESEKILKSETVGRNKYFMLNFGNIQTKLYLMQAEMFKTSLFLEKYPLIQPFAKDIKKISAPIIVFGSFAKFRANKTSDFDLLIVSEKKQDLPRHLLPCELHEVVLKDTLFFEGLQKKEALIIEILENHIILSNFSFFVNAMWDYYA